MSPHRDWKPRAHACGVYALPKSYLDSLLRPLWNHYQSIFGSEAWLSLFVIHKLKMVCTLQYLVGTVTKIHTLTYDTTKRAVKRALGPLQKCPLKSAVSWKHPLLFELRSFQWLIPSQGQRILFVLFFFLCSSMLSALVSWTVFVSIPSLLRTSLNFDTPATIRRMSVFCIFFWRARVFWPLLH
jgi:hypothetical protein